MGPTILDHATLALADANLVRQFLLSGTAIAFLA